MTKNSIPSASSSSSIFSLKASSRLPDDTVFYSIFPDDTSLSLLSIRHQIINTLSPFTSHYIWQHQPFSLSLSPSLSPPHLHGNLRFGDNLEDEWFVVFLLFQISRSFPSLSIRVWDSDGEFLLIEAAFHIPRWINPDNSVNRVFIRNGDVHIVPKTRLPEPEPNLVDSLRVLVGFEKECRASDSVQNAVKSKVSDYPSRAVRNMHRVRVRVPVSVASVLRDEPCLVSMAVEGFYDRDVDMMKHGEKMERFLRNGRGEELVCVLVKMSKTMYAQLMQQNFQASRCYPMPSRVDTQLYTEAELGMKIASGFEMMYQQRKRSGSEGKGETWEAFKKSLEGSGYFEGLLPGSKEYGRLMQSAEEYYRNSSLFSRTSDMIAAPVRRIDEILASSYSVEDFRVQEVPPSDDDSWLYNGDDELNAALLERQKEMESYNSKFEKNQKSKEELVDPSASYSIDESVGNISKSMQTFVRKVSSYQGAEVPENRDAEDVDFDVDRFIKEMESVMGSHFSMGTISDADDEDEPSSDLDFDESEDDGSDAADGVDNVDREDMFVPSYSNAMDEELKTSTLNRSFYRASEEASQKNEGTSNVSNDLMDENFTPVDVDVNLVKSFLDSFSSQEGLPGPASNLLGLMGIKLPRDSDNGK